VADPLTALAKRAGPHADQDLQTATQYQRRLPLSVLLTGAL
jgi:hypothetical protein